MIRILTIAMGMLFTASSFCQPLPCNYWPAPCPHTSKINEASNYQQRSNNGMSLKQELEFEANIKNLLTDEMQRVARLNGWRVYELTESNFNIPPYIFISYDDWGKTPYSKRPPKKVYIQYVVVVNKDSLTSWKDWTINELIPKANNAVNEFAAEVKTQENDPVIKSLYDSMMHYNTLYSKYIGDHATQYAKDIKENNEKGIKEHDRNAERYLSSMDAFKEEIEKRNKQTSEKPSNAVDRLEQEIKEKTTDFAEGSIVLITFSINPYLIGSGLQDGSQRSLTPQSKLTVEGSTYAGLLRNTLPYTEFHAPDEKGFDLEQHPSAIAFVLFGKFSKPDSFNNYPSSFTANYKTKQEVIGTEKQVPCDVVQTIAVHVKGRPDKVISVLQALDAGKLQSLILKKQ